MPLLEEILILVEAQFHIALLVVCLDFSLLLTIHEVAILAVQFCCDCMEDSKIITNIESPQGIFNISLR